MINKSDIVIKVVEATKTARNIYKITQSTPYIIIAVFQCGKTEEMELKYANRIPKESFIIDDEFNNIYNERVYRKGEYYNEENYDNLLMLDKTEIKEGEKRIIFGDPVRGEEVKAIIAEYNNIM